MVIWKTKNKGSSDLGCVSEQQLMAVRDSAFLGGDPPEGCRRGGAQLVAVRGGAGGKAHEPASTQAEECFFSISLVSTIAAMVFA